MRLVKLVSVLSILVLSVWGCSKKVDEKTPIEQVKAQAQQLFEAKNVEKLKSAALNIKEQIEEKTAELKPITEKISGVDFTKLIGDNADKAKKELEGLKSEATQLKTTISSLKDRFEIYYEKLVELKADVADLKM